MNHRPRSQINQERCERAGGRARACEGPHREVILCVPFPLREEADADRHDRRNGHLERVGVEGRRGCALGDWEEAGW